MRNSRLGAKGLLLLGIFVLLQFFSTKETIRNAQQEYLALDLSSSFSHENHETPDVMIKHYDLTTAEEDNTLYFVGSTYSPEDDSVYDGISRMGKRVVTLGSSAGKRRNSTGVTRPTGASS